MSTRVKRCPTCMHWSSPMPKAEVHYCQLAESKGGEAMYHIVTAVAEDWGSYHAVLRTTAEHGCTQHQRVVSK